MFRDLFERYRGVISCHCNVQRVENIDQVLEEVGQRFPAGLMGWPRNYQLIDNACWRLDELPIDAWNEYDECDGDYCQTVKRGFSRYPTGTEQLTFSSGPLN